MRILVLIPITVIMITACLAHPTPGAEEATTHSPIRTAVKYHMSIYLKQSEDIISNALKRLPETADTKKSRDILEEFLRHVELYRTKYENCDWNLLNFNKDLKTILNYFGDPNAPAEDKDVMKFMLDNGLQNVKNQCHIYVRQFLNGELGDEKDINAEFC